MSSSALLLAMSAASCVQPDTEAVAESPRESEEVAEAVQAVTTRRIPLRFIHLKDCTNPASCDTGRESTTAVYAAVDRANDVFAATGVELWVKSNEVIHAPMLDSQVAYNRSWAEAFGDLSRIFKGVEVGDYPPLTVKSNRYWLTIGAAFYGDPDVVHVFIVDANPEPGTDDDPATGHFAQYPDKGRSLHMIGLGGNGLPHELGHYFGLLHTFENIDGMFQPGTTTPWSRADRWDLYYCATIPPIFYTSKADYLAKNNPQNDQCPDPLEWLIDTDAGNRCTSGPAGEGPFECNMPTGGLPVLYTSGDPELDGLFRADPESANSMGYGSNWLRTSGPMGMSGAVPRFFSDSQVDIATAYMNNNTIYTVAQVAAFSPLPSGAPYTTLSYREELGTSVEDFVYWANGAPGDTATVPTNSTAFSFAYESFPISGTSYKSASGDFDGDGNDDIVWCSTVTSFASIWWGNDDRTFTTESRTGLCPTGFGAVRAGQFGGANTNANADDLLFYVPGTGTDYIKYGNTTGAFSQQQALDVDGTSYIPIVGNFDGASFDDIFWYKPSTGIIHRWYSNASGGFVPYDNYAVDAGGPFVPIAGNFDGSLGDDIFWYKAGTGADRIWYSLGNGALGFTKVSSLSNVQSTYTPVSGDFNGDGKDDIFWENATNLNDSIWSGATQSAQFTNHPASVLGTFAPIAGDFDGDDQTDIFWYRQ